MAREVIGVINRKKVFTGSYYAMLFCESFILKTDYIEKPSNVAD